MSARGRGAAGGLRGELDEQVLLAGDRLQEAKHEAVRGRRETWRVHVRARQVRSPRAATVQTVSTRPPRTPTISLVRFAQVHAWNG
jgi:hypothetical protein